MKTQSLLRRITALALLGGLATAAQAHPGHGASGLMAGLAHPLFGPDHLLAMVAVGVWSVAALPARKVWQGPAVFMLALAVSAVFGALGLTVPYLEHMVALSVVLFGAMLLLARWSMPAAAGPSQGGERPHGGQRTMRSGEEWGPHSAIGLGLIAVAASLHGLAHGAEAPASGFAGYVIGLLATTAALHAAGAGIGLSIRRWLAGRGDLALGSLGAAFGLAGVYLFGQLAA